LTKVKEYDGGNKKEGPIIWEKKKPKSIAIVEEEDSSSIKS
jgi:hypothetical protein